jgi:hypothetical protein
LLKLIRSAYRPGLGALQLQPNNCARLRYVNFPGWSHRRHWRSSDAAMLAEGYVVAAMTRTPEKIDGLRAAGVIPVLCDLFDQKSLNEAVTDFDPMSSLTR